MKNKISIMMLLVLTIMSLSGCKKNNDIDFEEDKKELISCISNELSSNMGNAMKNISIEDILDNKDVVVYYEGKYSNDSNRYMILSMSPEDAYVLNKFNRYYASRYDDYYLSYNNHYNLYLFVHSSNDIDITAINNRCMKDKDEDFVEKRIPSDIIKDLRKTDRIVINSGDTEIGMIKSKDSIKKIIDNLDNARAPLAISDVAYLCDGHAFDLKMYNGEEMIDSVKLWYDGMRVLPDSMNSSGCFYYSIDDDLRYIIEEETSYKFYSIEIIEGESNKKKERLIISSDTDDYYLECNMDDKVYIRSILTGKVMPIKDAIDNGYIDFKRLDDSGLFTKKARK